MRAATSEHEEQQDNFTLPFHLSILDEGPLHDFSSFFFFSFVFFLSSSVNVFVWGHLTLYFIA
jgi:hypothetical protein